MNIKHVVFFSSGIGSWAAAKRVAEQHGTDGLILLFADTKIEDPDNYRFLHESAANVGGELVIVADGRTPFEVFQDHRYLGNSKIAHCSEDLKQKPCRKWVKEQDPEKTASLHFGISWDEIHRMGAIAHNWKPWQTFAPLTEAPYLDKTDLLNWAASEGLQPPRTYQMGLPHANCLQRGCVRGGQAYWRHLLRVLPDSFASAEADEQALRDQLGRDLSHLTRIVNGEQVPFTLRQLREEVEAQGQIDLFDWGGCGCFVTQEVAA